MKLLCIVALASCISAAFAAPRNTYSETNDRFKRENSQFVNVIGDFRGRTRFNGLSGFNSQTMNIGGDHKGEINFAGSNSLEHSFNTHEAYVDGDFRGKASFGAGRGTFNTLKLKLKGQNLGNFDFEGAKPGSFNTVIIETDDSDEYTE